MLKLFKGDLLLFTPNGFKRADELSQGDLLLSLNKDGSISFDEIEEINKVFKKKYNLNKIEGYYFNDNIELHSIKNIPLNLELTEMKDYIENYRNNCLGLTKINELSSFDFIGFPIKNNNNENNNNDKIELNLKEIGKNVNKDKSLSLNQLFNLSKDELQEIHSGLIENNTEIHIDVSNKDTYHFLKYTCLLLGIPMYVIFKDGKLQIKISKKINENPNSNFIFNNFYWNKIKSIKKTSNFNGNLFNIKLKSNNPYLSDIGFIS